MFTTNVEYLCEFFILAPMAKMNVLYNIKESSKLSHPDSCTLLKIVLAYSYLSTSIASSINTTLFCSIFFPSSNLVPHLGNVPPQLMDGTYQTKLRS